MILWLVLAAMFVLGSACTRWKYEQKKSAGIAQDSGGRLQQGEGEVVDLQAGIQPRCRRRVEALDRDALPAQHPDAGAGGPLHLALVVPVVGEGVAAREHRRRVELGRGARQPAQRGHRVPGAQQRLRRDARPVGALTADQLALDDGHAQPTVGERAGYTALLFWTGQVLAYVIAFSPEPLYDAYAEQPERLLGLSPLTDQKLSAVVMMVEQALTLGIAFVLLYRAASAARTGTVAERPA